MLQSARPRLWAGEDNMDDWGGIRDAIVQVLLTVAPLIVTAYVWRSKRQAETGDAQASAAQKWAELAERSVDRIAKLEEENARLKAKLTKRKRK